MSTHFNVLDLFSGAGGFTLGIEKAGMNTIAFCEKNKVLRKQLNHHWPHVKVFHDVTETDAIVRGVAGHVSAIVGGDPCPIRSRARSNGTSNHPDLSGYFLALVGRLRPRWVVRENVPAPDDCHFTASLELLGYRTVIVRTDAAAFTSQQRIRDFIIGAHKTAWPCLPGFIRQFDRAPGHSSKSLGSRQVVPCLTAKRNRYDSRDCYIWEPSGLRIPDGDERTAFAGFPPGWFAGLSQAALARACGNAVVPAIVEKLAHAILTAESSIQ
ncbi:MAG: DNA cytosine methyltransferase [Desulfobulbus sp.]